MAKRIEKNSNASSTSCGTLYVVATPIGNHLDWTQRAIKILGEVEIVAAEDTRVLKRELQKVNVRPKKVLSHHNHNEEVSTKGLLEALLKGHNVALASDAGTPLVSDPGFKIVAVARQNGINIVPVPGASSLTAALSVSDLGGQNFFFGGFLPTQTDSRKRALKRFRNTAENLVFFEAPHRVREFLKDATEILGAQTPTVVCRELTKPYEEIRRGSLQEIENYFRVNEPRGEFVILFKGSPAEQLNAQATQSEVSKLLGFGKSASDILDELQNVTELNRKQLYDLITREKKLV